MNGPKSWSLAAVLRPEIRIAYDDAQDRVVEELARYLQQNVTTKVGKRGEQKSLHVDELSMVAVKHYTSRAGDPHRHIHLQVNARVLVDGVWRGLDSQALLRMSRAINGIGHRTVLADPRFRAAVAAAGFTFQGDGEIAELATAVPAMSERSAQISRQIGRFEKDWRKETPRPGTDAAGSAGVGVEGVGGGSAQEDAGPRRGARRGPGTRVAHRAAGAGHRRRPDADPTPGAAVGGADRGRRPGRDRGPGGCGDRRRRAGQVDVERARPAGRGGGGHREPAPGRSAAGRHGVRGGRHRPGPEHVHLGAGQPGRARARPAPHVHPGDGDGGGHQGPPRCPGGATPPAR